MRNTLIVAASAVALALVSADPAEAAFGTINNDAWKTTANGDTLYAQAGYIIKEGSTYYWYGQKTQAMVAYRNTGSPGSDHSWLGTFVYTSTDLINWSNGIQAVAPQGVIAAGTYQGRVCGVTRNSSGTYVMWMKHESPTYGKTVLCFTSSSPTGPFTYSHHQPSVQNIFSTGLPGDGTLFTDPVGGGVYLICADAHGRQRAYICPLSSDRMTINAATQIALWPQGQEAGNMFYNPAKQRYHYITSETNGYSYSFAYEVRASSLFGTYSGANFILPGTQATNTYWSQVTYCLPVSGSSGTVYMMMCDRWNNYSSNYAAAGHGTGFNVWCPITFSAGSDTTPTFQPLGTWQLDAAAGTWQQNTPSGTPPSYVGAGSAAAGTGTIAPSLPSGLQGGDILLLFVETANQAVSVSNQNGGTWASVNTPGGTGAAGGSDGARLTTFWSRYNGSQGAPTLSDSGDHQLARIIAIRGAVASGNPWNVVTNGDVDTWNDSGAWILGGTTTVDNTLVVVASAGSSPDADGTSHFSGWTNGNLTNLAERVDNTTSQGNGGSLGMATGVKAFAGDYGVTTATHATTGKKGLISIAIRP